MNLRRLMVASGQKPRLRSQPVADDAGALLAIDRPRFRLDGERVGA
jgi:hypothetical protein